MKVEIKNLQIYHSCDLYRVAKSFDRLRKFLEDFSLFIKTMLPYCLEQRKNTETKNRKVVTTKNGKIILLSKCEVCNSKKSKFIKQQEPSRSLNSFGIETPLSKIPIVGPVFSQSVK